METTLLGAISSNVGWAILLVGIALAADAALAEYRDWRRRREAMKHGRTLTTKFRVKRF